MCYLSIHRPEFKGAVTYDAESSLVKVSNFDCSLFIHRFSHFIIVASCINQADLSLVNTRLYFSPSSALCAL